MIVSSDTLVMYGSRVKQDHPGGATLKPLSRQPLSCTTLASKLYYHLGPTHTRCASPEAPSITQTTVPDNIAWQLVQQCSELDFLSLKQILAGNITAASNALCKQSCYPEETLGKQQHPTQLSSLPGQN